MVEVSTFGQRGSWDDWSAVVLRIWRYYSLMFHATLTSLGDSFAPKATRRRFALVSWRTFVLSAPSTCLRPSFTNEKQRWECLGAKNRVENSWNEIETNIDSMFHDEIALGLTLVHVISLCFCSLFLQVSMFTEALDVLKGRDNREKRGYAPKETEERSDWSMLKWLWRLGVK